MSLMAVSISIGLEKSADCVISVANAGGDAKKAANQ